MIVSDAMSRGHNGIFFLDALCKNALLYPTKSGGPGEEPDSAFLGMRICSFHAVHP